jgi:hypothetical protein
MTRKEPARRGRPPKFGRPARLVALTLPEDVLEGLARIHPDPAWAVVRLFDKAGERVGRVRKPVMPLPAIVQVSRHHSLIMVDPTLVNNLPRVSTIPMDEGRAFLALEGNGGLADLELAVLDRLEARDVSVAERGALLSFRTQLKAWRTDPSLDFEARSIIVVGDRRKKPRRRLTAAT